MVVVRSESNCDVDGRRNGGLEARQRLLDRFDRIDDIRAGLLEHDKEYAALAVGPCGLSGVGRAHDGLADVAHPDRGAVPIGDDDVVPGLGRRQLVVVVNSESLLLSDDRALGAVDGGDADLRPHVLELEVLLDELGRIDLDADRGRLLAADPHQGHAGNLADPLGEDVFRRIVDVDNRGDVRLRPTGSEWACRTG